MRIEAETERRVTEPDPSARRPIPVSRDSPNAAARGPAAGNAAAENGSLCAFLCIDMS